MKLGGPGARAHSGSSPGRHFGAVNQPSAACWATLSTGYYRCVCAFPSLGSSSGAYRFLAAIEYPATDGIMPPCTHRTRHPLALACTSFWRYRRIDELTLSGMRSMSLKLSSLPPIKSNLSTKALGEIPLQPSPVIRSPAAARTARSRSRMSTTRGVRGRICGEAWWRECNRICLRRNERRHHAAWGYVLVELEREAGPKLALQ